MRLVTLLRRGLVHYWRTNLAVVAGVAVAVAVLAGALIVGASVRASLRDLAVQRLGNTDQVLLSTNFFRDELAQELGIASAPMILLEGTVTSQDGARRTARVQVYGVDQRFWTFHDLPTMKGPFASDAYVSEALAAELGVAEGQSVILRVESAAAIPIESMHGRKDDLGRTARLAVTRVLHATELGEFSLSPRQGSVRAIFVPLRRMQILLGQPDHLNTVLVAQGEPDLPARLRKAAVLDDYGLKTRLIEGQRSLALESSSAILSDGVVASAERVLEQLRRDSTDPHSQLTTIPTLTYLANSIEIGDRRIPYSVVTALDVRALQGVLDVSSLPSSQGADPIVLNSWAARDLNARVGDEVRLEYYFWDEGVGPGRLVTRTAQFRLVGIVPVEGPAADRDLVPDYPGITDSDRLADWDPPFPVNLQSIRPIDEDYWQRYRGTPKAFVSLETGQRLWRTRYGAVTALRVRFGLEGLASANRQVLDRALLRELDPLTHGFTVLNARGESLAASAGAADFGEYFTYFSTFLVASALLLAALFFKLGVEQRLSEVGLLRAIGFDERSIEKLFVGEALLLSTAGALLGIGGAIGYGAIIMHGLRTWWVGAVGTTALTLHVDVRSLLTGALMVVAISVACIWWTLRSLRRSSARSLLKGSEDSPTKIVMGSDPIYSAGVGLALLATAMLTAASDGWIGRVTGFFGAGSALLAAALCLAASWLRSNKSTTIAPHGALPVWRLGFRNATHRPARSVLCMALIAFATFVIVAVEAFKRDDSAARIDPHSGVGGYSLLAESLLPIVYDPNTPDGRDALNLPEDVMKGVRLDRFRVRPGDDTSCLNLYQPRNPRVLGATAAFISSGRFAFQSSLADTSQERANPWLLLHRTFEDGAIPVIADANSMTYVLHKKLGEDVIIPGNAGHPVTLRLVGALADSVLQSELIMAESYFIRVFPEWEGYRLFLGETATEHTEAVTTVLESRLGDSGLDVTSTTARLAGFHRVEYTYLSTFQMLGGLGLVLGTIGLGAVLLRNVLERRRELALLRALGYRHADLVTIVIAENVLLLAFGLATGTIGALLAIAPSLAERGAKLPSAEVGALLLAVFITGLVASFGATIAALRSPVLPALKAE